MKIAFAGFGHEHIISIYNLALNDKRLQIAGTCEGNKKTAESLKDYGIIVDYNDYEMMLESSDADIIAIGAPFGERGNMVIKALERGKHVILDKPVCTKISELEQIENLINEKNLKLGCMLTLRYSGQFAAAYDLIKNGAIGEIKTITFGLQHPLLYGTRPDWYFCDGKHGGVINDIAVHAIDFIRYASGLRPEKVLSARCWNAYATKEPSFKDCAQFMLRLENGAGVIGDVSYSIPDTIKHAYPKTWEFFGSEGIVKIVMGTNQIEVYSNKSVQKEIVEAKTVERNYLDDFLDDIAGKKDLILTTHDALTSTRDALSIQEFANNS